LGDHETRFARLTFALAIAVLSLAATPTPAAPTVYPTGTTIYDPARAWSGYTVLSPLGTEAAIVIEEPAVRRRLRLQRRRRYGGRGHSD